MRDYSIVVTLTFGLSASSQEKAEQRAQEVADSIEIKKQATWLDTDNLEAQVAVEET